jgi:hypothetical protein
MLWLWSQLRPWAAPSHIQHTFSGAGNPLLQFNFICTEDHDLCFGEVMVVKVTVMIVVKVKVNIQAKIMYIILVIVLVMVIVVVTVNDHLYGNTVCTV